ncbi:DUF5047 domain-containing protein [Streptomyces sp. CB03911]|uniref:DUF5047 domain-containing protein n=1 Tax=Streptomyces sp. CB03911 TaxID=1804758 RepID=UPI0009395AF8|nr:DUF5047 domain-containing protein [Streptomyces sp. CB03911]OKI19307.1 peptidase [Streptomyces sp. CB03911]
MYSVSAAFLAALSTPHQVVTKVDAYFGGVLTVADLPIDGGSVSVDRGSKVRRSLTVTLADPAYLPWDATDPLAVYGQQLAVSRGIKFPDGTVELVPLGLFRVDEPQGDVDMGPVTVTGKTSEAIIQDDRFVVPVSTAGYVSTVAAITDLLHQTIPGAVIVNATAGTRDPAVAVVVWDAQADRWDAVQQLAASMHAEIYVDVLDRFVIADVPDLSTAVPVWDIADGPTGNLISASRAMSRAGVYNGVIVSGENTASGSAPVSGSAYDTDPTSPTRWGGPYGHVPRFYSSGLLTSGTACSDLATSMLRDSIAPNVTTSINSLPNSALEAGDCLRLRYAGGRKDLVLAQAFSVPLDVESDFPITLRGSKEDTS